MLAAKRQQRKRAESTGGAQSGDSSNDEDTADQTTSISKSGSAGGLVSGSADQTTSGSASNSDSDSDSDNLAIYPLTIPLLAGPSAIMSVIVVNAGFAGALASTLTGYAALLAMMVPPASFCA